MIRSLNVQDRGVDERTGAVGLVGAGGGAGAGAVVGAVAIEIDVLDEINEIVRMCIVCS